MLWTITEPCLNREFPREELKNFHAKQFRLHSRTSCTRSRQEEEWEVIHQPVNNSREQNVLALIVHGHPFFFFGDRNVQKECAKRIPTALALLSFRGVLPFLLFFIRSTGTANDGGFVPRCNGCDPFSQCVKKKTMFIWVILNENVNYKTCSNPGFLLELWKNYQKPEFQGNLMRTLFLHGPMIWKVM